VILDAATKIGGTQPSRMREDSPRHRGGSLGGWFVLERASQAASTCPDLPSDSKIGLDPLGLLL